MMKGASPRSRAAMHDYFMNAQIAHNVTVNAERALETSTTGPWNHSSSIVVPIGVESLLRPLDPVAVSFA